MTDELLEDAKRKVVMLCQTWASDEQIRQISNALTVAFSGIQLSKQETALSTEVLTPNEEYLKQFLAIKIVKGLSRKTLSYYNYVVRRFFDASGKLVNQVTTNDIRVYLAMREMRDGVSKVTLNNERRCLRSFFTTLSDEELIGQNPAGRVDNIKEPKRVKKAFTEMELERIRNAAGRCEKSKLNQLRDVAIIEVLYSTGCRVSELCGMNRADIAGDCVTVIGKGNKERICYLNSRALMALENYLSARGDTDPWIFAGKCGRLRSGRVERIVKEIGTLAGVENCHPHRFRRTAATIALRRGMPIEQVSKMLGHSQITTTQIYAITEESDVYASHQKYLA